MSKERLEEIKDKYRNPLSLAGLANVPFAHKGEPPFEFVRVNDLEWLIEQAERAQKNAQDLEDMDRQLYSEQQQNKRYREALEFYADKDNYFMRYDSHTREFISSPMFNDEGELARKALKVEVGRSK